MRSLFEEIKSYLCKETETELTYKEKLERALDMVRREIIGLAKYRDTLTDEEQKVTYTELIENLKKAKEDLKKRIENGKN